MNHDAWAGSAGGVVAADDDSITQVTLGDGTAATAYNFCDVLPASISGSVADCLAESAAGQRDGRIAEFHRHGDPNHDDQQLRRRISSPA